jgi:hypothetical protein
MWNLNNSDGKGKVTFVQSLQYSVMTSFDQHFFGVLERSEPSLGYPVYGYPLTTPINSIDLHIVLRIQSTKIDLTGIQDRTKGLYRYNKQKNLYLLTNS